MGRKFFDCSKCGFNTDDRMSAAKHATDTLHTFFEPHPSMPAVFLCRACDLEFLNRVQATQHVDNFGHDVIDSEGLNVQPTLLRFGCESCSFVTHDSNYAVSHVATTRHRVSDQAGRSIKAHPSTVKLANQSASNAASYHLNGNQHFDTHILNGGTLLSWPNNAPDYDWLELTLDQINKLREAVRKELLVAMCYGCGARFSQYGDTALTHFKLHRTNHNPMWSADVVLATHSCLCDELFSSEDEAIRHCVLSQQGHKWTEILDPYPMPLSTDTKRAADMFETIVRLYTTAMITGVTSPTPHIVGPPGCGKSTVAQQVADLAGVTLHTINVSRLSPLDLEGVQMPDKQHSALKMLTATFWTQLKEGDIVLFDEFLRGFPEVYNGLLDIFTSRQVGAFKLPKVFIMAASNSVATYDPALEDRLMHILVPDPRHNSTARSDMIQRVIDGIGLFPDVATSSSMTDLLADVVLPTFEVLDSFKGLNGMKAPVSSTSSTTTTMSIRKLIGMARLRHVTCSPLSELIDTSNRRAIQANKPQYVVLTDGKNVPTAWITKMESVRNSPKLTPLQRENLELNFSLIEVEESKVVKGKDHNDDDVTTDDD